MRRAPRSASAELRAPSTRTRHEPGGALPVPGEVAGERRRHLRRAPPRSASRPGCRGPRSTGCPAAPLANSSSVSLVDVSPSTVRRLKVASAVRRSTPRRKAGLAAASVTRNESIVAMWGSIIPEPLAIPASVTSRPAETDPPRRGLGEGVGGHDGARSVGQAALRQRGGGGANPPAHLRHGKGLTDHARGRHQHLAVGGADRAAGRPRHGFRVPQAARSHGDVGDSAVRHDAPRAPRAHQRARELHRGTDHGRAREDARGGRRHVADDQGEVEALGLDPAVDAAESKSGNEDGSALHGRRNDTRSEGDWKSGQQAPEGRAQRADGERQVQRRAPAAGARSPGPGPKARRRSTSCTSFRCRRGTDRCARPSAGLRGAAPASPMRGAPARAPGGGAGPGAGALASTGSGSAKRKATSTDCWSMRWFISSKSA